MKKIASLKLMVFVFIMSLIIAACAPTTAVPEPAAAPENIIIVTPDSLETFDTLDTATGQNDTTAAEDGRTDTPSNQIPATPTSPVLRNNLLNANDSRGAARIANDNTFNANDDNSNDDNANDDNANDDNANDDNSNDDNSNDDNSNDDNSNDDNSNDDDGDNSNDDNSNDDNSNDDNSNDDDGDNSNDDNSNDDNSNDDDSNINGN